MCGITALIRFDGQPVSHDIMARMNRALAHRGPDDSGVHIDNTTGLGHTRLSIVDTANGQQPMHCENRRYTISFNGEIYNYQKKTRELLRLGHNFDTHCDTETILRLHMQYGDEAITQLDGMFSYALYDKETQRLILVRDRLGIKPLYFHQNKDFLIAASEIKAIFASGLVEPQFDYQTLYDHFYYQFSITPYTSFKDICEVPPGHLLIIEKGQPPRLEQYWDLNFPKDGEYESLDETYWEKAFGDALDASCQSHLIGDVPIGTYLSGGLDSSTTSYLLNKHYRRPLDSFSIHFEDPNSDESYAYKPVAEKFGINNIEMTISDPAPKDFIHTLEECVYHLEQPQRMAVDIPHFMLSDKVHQHGTKVVYTGDGADEIFGGYDCYRQDAMRIWGNEQTDDDAREKLYLEEYTKQFANEFVHMLMKLHRPEKQQEVISTYGTYPAWFDSWHILDDQIADLWVKHEQIDSKTRLPEFARDIKPKIEGLHPLNQSLYYETKTRLNNWILLKSDRLSMSHSVEARVPFLDHHLVELAAKIPPQYKLSGMDEKYLLKKFMKPHLPEIPGEYKKRGFYTPIREWFFGPGRDHGKYLDKEVIEEIGIFNPEVVEKLRNELENQTELTDLHEYYLVLRKEWLLMLVLTTHILHHQFILKEAPIFHDI